MVETASGMTILTARDPSVRSPSTPRADAASAANIWQAIFLAVLVGKAAEWIPGLAQVPLVKITFLITALCAYRARKTLVPVRLWSLKIMRPALAFLALSVLSVLFSAYKSATLVASEVSIIYLLSMTVLVKITQTQRDVERLLVGLAVAGVSLSLGLLFNYSGGRAHINAHFDPNDIAYELDTLLPIVLVLRAGGSPLRRVLIHLAALGMVIAILLTGSRGGEIGLGVVLLGVTAFPLDLGSKRGLKRFSATGTLLRATVLVAIGVLAWGHLPTESKERLVTLLDLQHDYNADPNSNASRTVLWRRDIASALRRPIGYGMGNASFVDGRNGGNYRTAHNSLVEALVELGVLGLWLYLYTNYVTWRELGRLTSLHVEDDRDKVAMRVALYARAFRIALAGNLVAGFFLSQAYSASLWMMVAVCAAFVKIATAEKRAPTAPTVA